MKTLTRLGMIILLAAVLCAAQSHRHAQPPAQPIETAFTFDWLVANAPPGDCGCFSLTGVSESVAVSLDTHWSVVGAGGIAMQPDVNQSGMSLHFSRLLAGGRYTWRRTRTVSWFVQGLAGIAHLNGSGYTPATAFAFQPGAGLDIALGHGILFRPVALDDLRTALPNGASNRQNTLRYSVGIVFRFGGHF